MSRRQLVLDAFNNKPVERVPVGFWFHFTNSDEWAEGVKNPAIIQKNIDGHNKFVSEFRPDFVKLMSDGFFQYPNPILLNTENVEKFFELEPIGPDHPWIVKQVELVKTLTDSFGNEVLTFYNVFAPATFFKILFGNNGNKVLADLILENKDAVKHALNTIAKDLSTLAQKVISEGNADGIYLSVQNVQDSRISPELYKEVIAPSELLVLESANKISENNILHICGYEGSRNDLNLYVDYDAKIINWAVNVEGISLAEGKKLFGGRAVIGGFDNTANGILYKGSQEEIEAFTEKLLREAGKTGIVLGADCTVPSDIDLNRLHWVRNKAQSLSAEL
ncbi:uroporphyrinogen decarboxylase [Defluviitalea raffinosedens]|uniref:Uroporphyrinogen decarboxylase n=1 Tax=Defluviitalea raffinosedens TaxID=1450156 RepID=A0A7C8LCB2_9FIRM|nr:uroporphyrinogen decarboxylase family protein [Defluviitalea raffinosedens]KAE9630646.1 uroporphyrinogen decarboxylase [Defluviitalea raffinosedens]